MYDMHIFESLLLVFLTKYITHNHSNFCIISLTIFCAAAGTRKIFVCLNTDVSWEICYLNLFTTYSQIIIAIIRDYMYEDLICFFLIGSNSFTNFNYGFKIYKISRRVVRRVFFKIFFNIFMLFVFEHNIRFVLFEISPPLLPLCRQWPK